METVYVVKGAQDVKGIKLDPRQEYLLKEKLKMVRGQNSAAPGPD